MSPKRSQDATVRTREVGWILLPALAGLLLGEVVGAASYAKAWGGERIQDVLSVPLGIALLGGAAGAVLGALAGAVIWALFPYRRSPPANPRPEGESAPVREAPPGRCPACGAAISPEQARCPECGIALR